MTNAAEPLQPTPQQPIPQRRGRCAECGLGFMASEAPRPRPRFSAQLLCTACYQFLYELKACERLRELGTERYHNWLQEGQRALQIRRQLAEIRDRQEVQTHRDEAAQRQKPGPKPAPLTSEQRAAARRAIAWKEGGTKMPRILANLKREGKDYKDSTLRGWIARYQAEEPRDS